MTQVRDGHWLRASRRQLGLTLRQLADRLYMYGTHAPDHLRHMEKGRRAIPGAIRSAVEQMLQNGKV